MCGELGNPVRLKIALLLVLFPGSVLPSEGLKYAAAYMCEPMIMTQAIVNSCAVKNSRLSPRLAAAFSSWRERNAATAERMEKECLVELRKRSASEEELQEVVAKLHQLNMKAIDALHNNANPDAATFCDDFVFAIESEKSDLENFFPQKK